MVRDKIIEAAGMIFSRKGYHPASMDEIAQAAGVAKGSLYYHFHGKSELFTAVICEGIAIIRRQVDQALAASSDAQTVLTAFIAGLLQTCLEYPDLVDLIMEERVSDIDPETSDQVRRARMDFVSYAAALIDEGVREGLLRPCHSQAAAAGAIALIYAYYRTASKAGTSLAEIVRETSELVLKGLAKS